MTDEQLKLIVTELVLSYKIQMMEEFECEGDERINGYLNEKYKMNTVDENEKEWEKESNKIDKRVQKLLDTMKISW